MNRIVNAATAIAAIVPSRAAEIAGKISGPCGEYLKKPTEAAQAESAAGMMTAGTTKHAAAAARVRGSQTANSAVEKRTSGTKTPKALMTAAMSAMLNI